MEEPLQQKYADMGTHGRPSDHDHHTTVSLHRPPCAPLPPPPLTPKLASKPPPGILIPSTPTSPGIKAAPAAPPPPPSPSIKAAPAAPHPPKLASLRPPPLSTPPPAPPAAATPIPSCTSLRTPTASACLLQLPPQRTPTMRFHWQKLVPSQLHDSVWNTRTPTLHVDIDFETLVNDFAAKVNGAVTRLPTCAAHTQEQGNVPQLLSLGRANTVGVFLARLGLSLDDVRHAIEQLPCQGSLAAALDVSQLSGLLVCLPKEQEAAALTAYTGDHSSLRLPEQFMLRMMSIPCVRQRIEAGRLYKTISDDLAALESAAGTLHTALGQLRGSITLAAIQQVVLVMGNFLNQGSKSGDCVGFKVESLLRLKDTKSPCKRSKTLLHAVAQEVSDNFLAQRSLSIDTPALAPAAKFAVAPLRTELEVLNTRMALVQEAAMSLKEGQQDDAAAQGFVQAALEMCTGTQPRLDRAAAALAAVDTAYHDLMTYLHGGAPGVAANTMGEADTLLRLLATFAKDLDAAHADNDAQAHPLTQQQHKLRILGHPPNLPMPPLRSPLLGTPAPPPRMPAPPPTPSTMPTNAARCPVPPLAHVQSLASQLAGAHPPGSSEEAHGDMQTHAQQHGAEPARTVSVCMGPSMPRMMDAVCQTDSNVTVHQIQRQGSAELRAALGQLMALFGPAMLAKVLKEHLGSAGEGVHSAQPVVVGTETMHIGTSTETLTTTVSDMGCNTITVSHAETSQSTATSIGCSTNPTTMCTMATETLSLLLRTTSTQVDEAPASPVLGVMHGAGVDAAMQAWPAHVDASTCMEGPASEGPPPAANPAVTAAATQTDTVDVQMEAIYTHEIIKESVYYCPVFALDDEVLYDEEVPLVEEVDMEQLALLMAEVDAQLAG